MFSKLVKILEKRKIKLIYCSEIICYCFKAVGTHYHMVKNLRKFLFSGFVKMVSGFSDLLWRTRTTESAFAEIYIRRFRIRSVYKTIQILFSIFLIEYDQPIVSRGLFDFQKRKKEKKSRWVKNIILFFYSVVHPTVFSAL